MCKVKSVDEFLKIVFEKIAKADGDDPFNIFWFRGESCDDEGTPLVPSAYREIFKKLNSDKKRGKQYICENEHSYCYIETNIRANFDRKALPYILSKNIENTAWNRYFLMQHYNVKTRLLDWTEDAIKALFFAIKDDADKDAKVWILQPFNLNLFTMGKLTGKELKIAKIPPLSNDFDKPQGLLDEEGIIRLGELTRRYLTMDFDGGDYYPLAIDPPFLDERMAAQKACFTMFGDEFNGGFNELQDEYSSDKKILDCVILDGKSKKKMLKDLQLIGIDNSSVYPDLEGLGTSIMNKYEEAYKHVFTLNPNLFQ